MSETGDTFCVNSKSDDKKGIKYEGSSGCSPPCLSDDVLLRRCSAGHQSSTGPVEKKPGCVKKKKKSLLEDHVRMHKHSLVFCHSVENLAT